MPRPWLTIVTVTKDDPAGLERTLASTAVWRARPGVEQIVVHAGKAPGALPEGARGLPQTGTGIASAFNEGLDAANGDWIWFLNGGDAAHEELEPGWLQTWARSTSAEVLLGTVQRDGEAAARPHPAPSGQRLWRRCWPQHPAAIVRRESLRAAGGFDPSWVIAMDYDLWFRLLGREGPVDVLSVPFARFDVNGLSSRAECRSRLDRENARLIWREKGRLLAALFRETRDALRALAKALRDR